MNKLTIEMYLWGPLFIIYGSSVRRNCRIKQLYIFELREVPAKVLGFHIMRDSLLFKGHFIAMRVKVYSTLT